jgi:transporter family-2 protein
MPTSFWTTGLYLLGVTAGASFVFQQAVNANLRGELGSAFWAGFISYLGGTLAMLAMILILREPALSAQLISRSSWMSWTGGVFGAIYIAIAIFAIPRLGAATTVALIVFGQMATSIAFDHFGILGVAQHAATPARLAGVVLLVAGVVLIRF